MRINRKLNLVLTLDLEGGGTAYVHSVPIRPEVWETYFLPISKTWAAMFAQGPMWLATQGPRTAALMLKKVAEADGSWDGPDGVLNGLVAEVRRVSNALLPNTAGGWQTVPLADALGQKLISDADAREVDNAITFFTVGCAALMPSEADEVMSQTFGMYGAQVTSFNSTEFLASLTTSTVAESTGESQTLSSIPR